MDRVREVALKVLYDVNKNGAYANIALDKALKSARKTIDGIDNKDVGFISEIVYGTISWKLTIDEVIQKYSNIKIKKISPWILNVLRLSIYQILFLDKVPKSAAVNEGVNLAKRYGHRASSNFVNAILRKVDKKDYEGFFQIENEVERISKTTSMPVWIIEKLLPSNSLESVKKICESSHIKPKLCIRVNVLKTNPKRLKEELEALGIKVECGEIENFLLLEGAKNIESLHAFQEGKFTVQDEAAGLIAKVLNPQTNERILDACSSPGGKTTFMAEMMKNQGKIIAWDLHEHRVNLVSQVANRLGIDIIQTEVKDATQYEKKYNQYFDKILLDVPCLGLGVLKRKPDIKWKRKKEDVQAMVAIQEQILKNCANYLKKGGEMVYSTCSILKEENEAIIQKFLQDNKDFRIQKILLEKEEFFKQFVQEKGFVQVYQNEKTDGFFMSKLRKIK